MRKGADVPQPAAAYDDARAAMEADDAERALEITTRLLSLDMTDELRADVLWLRASANRRLGRPPAVRTDLKRFIEVARARRSAV